MPFCLQESSSQENIATREYADQLAQELNTRLSDLTVSFMDTADVMMVVTALANFQIQIVLDLYGYMKYGK